MSVFVTLLESMSWPFTIHVCVSVSVSTYLLEYMSNCMSVTVSVYVCVCAFVTVGVSS